MISPRLIGTPPMAVAPVNSDHNSTAGVSQIAGVSPPPHTSEVVGDFSVKETDQYLTCRFKAKSRILCRIWFCAFIVLAAGAMLLSGGKPRWGFRASRPILVADASLNIGEVWESDQHVVSIPIKNVSGKDIVIKGFQNSCRCTQIRPGTLTIQAGETTTIEVVVNLVDLAARTPPLNSNRPFQIEIRPILDGEDNNPSQPSWQISGRVKRAITSETRFVSFGRQSAHTLPLPPRSVRIAALPGVESLVVESESPNISAQVARSGISSDTFVLEIQDRGFLATSAFQFEIAVYPISNGSRLPPIRIPVEGTIVPDIFANTPTMAFGAHPIGAILEDVVAIQSMTKRKFTVTRFEALGSGLRIVALPDIDIDHKYYRVLQKVASQGDQSSEIRFHIRDDENIERRIAVTVSHYGLPATTQIASHGPPR